MSEAGSRRLALVVLAALLTALTWLAFAPAVEGSRIVLAAVGGSPDWLIGVFRPLGAGLMATSAAGGVYYLALMLATALWAAVVWLAPRIGHRTLLCCGFALIVVFLLAPPLLSQDVFSYIAYARLGVTHSLNPYAYRPFDIPADPVFPFAGSKDAVDVYGPFFTLLTYPLALLSVPAFFWALKALAAASVGGILLLVDSIARRTGANRARAVALVGLAPATLVHVVAGAHNEALTMLIVLAGVAIAASAADGAREPAGGFVSALAVGVKASAAVPLVFMLAGARRRAAMLGAMLGAGLLTALTAWAGFGPAALGALGLISSNQERSSRWSVPHKAADGLTAVFGDLSRASATGAIRVVLLLLLLLLVVLLIRRSWKAPSTWIANAGWATLAVLIASAWLVPWYLLWLLPLAALGRDPRLIVASIVFGAYTLVIAIPF